MLGADELVLLKSALPTQGPSADELAAAGYIDKYLVRLLAELPRVRVVNFRARDFPFTLLKGREEP